MPIPKNSKKVLINAAIHSGDVVYNENINIKIGTLLNPGIGYQYLNFRSYNQNAFNSNICEFELKAF